VAQQWKKIITSGSNAALHDVTISGNVSASGYISSSTAFISGTLTTSFLSASGITASGIPTTNKLPFYLGVSSSGEFIKIDQSDVVGGNSGGTIVLPGTNINVSGSGGTDKEYFLTDSFIIGGRKEDGNTFIRTDFVEGDNQTDNIRVYNELNEGRLKVGSKIRIKFPDGLTFDKTIDSIVPSFEDDSTPKLTRELHFTEPITWTEEQREASQFINNDVYLLLGASTISTVNLSQNISITNITASGNISASGDIITTGNISASQGSIAATTFTASNVPTVDKSNYILGVSSSGEFVKIDSSNVGSGGSGGSIVLSGDNINIEGSSQEQKEFLILETIRLIQNDQSIKEKTAITTHVRDFSAFSSLFSPRNIPDSFHKELESGRLNVGTTVRLKFPDGDTSDHVITDIDPTFAEQDGQNVNRTIHFSNIIGNNTVPGTTTSYYVTADLYILHNASTVSTVGLNENISLTSVTASSHLFFSSSGDYPKQYTIDYNKTFSSSIETETGIVTTFPHIIPESGSLHITASGVKVEGDLDADGNIALDGALSFNGFNFIQTNIATTTGSTAFGTVASGSSFIEVDGVFQDVKGGEGSVYPSDLTHEFTGSVLVTGSLSVNGTDFSSLALQSDVTNNQTSISTNTDNIALKENAANKSTDTTLSDVTDVKFPTEKAVKTYVDDKISNIDLPADLENITTDILPNDSSVDLNFNTGKNIGSSTKKFNDLFAVNTFFGGIHEINLETEGLDQMQEGTILSLKDGALHPCEKNADLLVMGVVSKGRNYPIVLGAEPILITGKIKAGDYIITSKVKGHGKGINPKHIYSKRLFGKIIAQAIEDGEGKSYTIKAMIRKM